MKTSETVSGAQPNVSAAFDACQPTGTNPEAESGTSTESVAVAVASQAALEAIRLKVNAEGLATNATWMQKEPVKFKNAMPTSAPRAKTAK